MHAQTAERQAREFAELARLRLEFPDGEPFPDVPAASSAAIGSASGFDGCCSSRKSLPFRRPDHLHGRRSSCSPAAARPRNCEWRSLDAASAKWTCRAGDYVREVSLSSSEDPGLVQGAVEDGAAV
jgi:hypothetical protein